MGFNYPGHPLRGVVLMTLYPTGLAVVLGYAVFRSGSVLLSVYLAVVALIVLRDPIWRASGAALPHCTPESTPAFERRDNIGARQHEAMLVHGKLTPEPIDARCCADAHEQSTERQS
jgi:hypothetical protein